MKFKVISGIYYIGDDVESVVYYDNDKKAVYFKEKDKETGSILYKVHQCIVYKLKFSEKYIFENNLSTFSYMFKKDNHQINFECIAYAFSDFLEKSGCSTPILASFVFAQNLQIIEIGRAHV